MTERPKDNDIQFQGKTWIPCEPEEWETLDPGERFGLVNTNHGNIYMYFKPDPAGSR